MRSYVFIDDFQLLASSRTILLALFGIGVPLVNPLLIVQRHQRVQRDGRRIAWCHFTLKKSLERVVHGFPKALRALPWNRNLEHMRTLIMQWTAAVCHELRKRKRLWQRKVCVHRDEPIAAI